IRIRPLSLRRRPEANDQLSLRAPVRPRALSGRGLGGAGPPSRGPVDPRRRGRAALLLERIAVARRPDDAQLAKKSSGGRALRPGRLCGAPCHWQYGVLSLRRADGALSGAGGPLRSRGVAVARPLIRRKPSWPAWPRMVGSPDRVASPDRCGGPALAQCVAVQPARLQLVRRAARRSTLSSGDR